MGEKTSSAIKENAFVTQVELKRMQLNQLISMEEMKINTLQTEIRAAKRRMTKGSNLTAELSDLFLQENDVRMHIRQLKADIAHLDPGWEESLEVIRRDGRVIDEAVAILLPYAYIDSIQNRLNHMHKEESKCKNAYDKLEAKLLRRELESIKYPSFDGLTLEEMEELQLKIPVDISCLQNKEQTKVNLAIQEELNKTLVKIKAHYPRRKVESLAGKLTSLDLHGPYPEEPAALQPLINQVKDDLAKLSEIPNSAEKTQFSKALSEKVAFLAARADANIPEAKAKRKKINLIITLIGIGLTIICIIIAIIFGISTLSRNSSEKEPGGLVEQVQNLITDDQGKDVSPSAAVGEQGMPGQYEEYTATFIEVISSVTYLREAPNTNANGTYKVVQGDILMNISEESLPVSWYKVSTLDGSASGYLAIDWVVPITVLSIPGEQLSSELRSVFYTLDFSYEDKNWSEDSFDDDFARGQLEYQESAFEIDVTANNQYVYYYANQSVDDLPEEYLFSLTIEVIDLSESAYYGLQTHVVDESNFDAVLISPDGSLKILEIRNGLFTILYDTGTAINTMVELDPDGINTLSVLRLTDPVGNTETYQYAINDEVFAEIIMGKLGDKGSSMGSIIYLDQVGDHAIIRIDDFTVKQ
jgi:hypothetical protein